MSTKLALLICDTPIPTVKAEHGSYRDIFHELLKSSLPKKRGLPQKFTLDGFDVVNGEYPTKRQLEGYQGILISGSGELYPVRCMGRLGLQAPQLAKLPRRMRPCPGSLHF